MADEVVLTFCHGAETQKLKNFRCCSHPIAYRLSLVRLEDLSSPQSTSNSSREEQSEKK